MIKYVDWLFNGDGWENRKIVIFLFVVLAIFLTINIILLVVIYVPLVETAIITTIVIGTVFYRSFKEYKKS
jgi:hypothetical protein